MTFEVIDLFTGWSHGSFATLRQARVAAERMHLRGWQIWRGNVCVDNFCRHDA
jgi:hypothetical protein